MASNYMNYRLEMISFTTKYATFNLLLNTRFTSKLSNDIISVSEITYYCNIFNCSKFV